MAQELSDDSPAFLSTLLVDGKERHLAITVVVLSALVFVALLPFARIPLKPVPAFIGIYESALVINDLITATLLFGQFAHLRSRALWILACAYLFTSFTTISHALTFPGVFSSTGLIDAGSQSAAWLYCFWHGGFPLCVVAYARLSGQTRVRPRVAVARGILAVLIAVAGFTLLSTAGHAWLPPILVDNHYTATGTGILAAVWTLSLISLSTLWRRKQRSVLDLWLMVVMCAWLFDIALSAVFNSGRYDLGFYAGRVYGLLAASFVLLVLLLENGRLYFQLSEAHADERKKAADLTHLNQLIELRVQEHLAAIEALHNQREESRAVIDNVLDAVITIDINGIVRSANQSVERILGFRADQVIGHNVAMLMPQPHRAAHDGHLDSYRRTGQSRVMNTLREVEGLHRNGELIALELSLSEYLIKGERFFTGTLHDIRERKRYIAELTRARAEAEQANRAKANFLASMSHEIRTPMNGVIGMIDVLHQSSLKGYQVEMVDLIRESAFSLLTIIDDILDFSKIEAGRLEIERAPMSIAAVVEKACSLLDHLALRKQVEFTLFADPTLPDLVLGDALRLRQVLINLANNAIKFSSDPSRVGRVSVRAKLVQRLAERVTVEFDVIDNGIGMDPDTLAALFVPFAQADVSTTRRFGGTGLGLAISRNLAELMGGSISVRSIKGQGSNFTLSLPFGVAADQPADHVSSANSAGLSCLVVGDSSSLSDDLASYLREDGAQVEQVTELAGLRARTTPPPAGWWIWVIDTAGHAAPTLDSLHAAANFSAAAQIRFVVIGRGSRRYPHRQDAERILIDGNVLSRRTLLKAVAMAAERLPDEDETTQTGQKGSECRAPSRAEAIRQGRLILVVEDNETNRKVILHQFALLGFTADVVNDGLQALECWRSGLYALLLTDLNMPEMDGYQLTQAIRAEEARGRRIPIVALTANALRHEAERCRAVGMDDYLSKPAQLVDLKAMLEKWLPAQPDEHHENHKANGRGTGDDNAAVSPRQTVDGNDPDAHSKVSGGNDAAERRRNQPALERLDVSVLTRLIGDDPAIVREFLQDFQSSASAISADLRTAVRAGDPDAATDAAHKLKSSARAVGALRLGELCAQIEDTGKGNRSEPWHVLLADFDNEMAAVDDALNAFCATGIPAPDSPAGTADTAATQS